MAILANNLCELIGDTPLLRLDRYAPDTEGRLLGKLESRNPGASVKDRIGLAMIEAAEKEGKLKPGGTIIEPTSGNTGIGLAVVAAVRGYRLIITMPESMSIERRKLLQGLGAEIVLTPSDEGMVGAVNQANELLSQIPGSYMPQQFQNPANPQVHYRTTGPEIWDATGGRVDLLVAGVGTGGTISGAGRFLKEKNSAVRCIAVEPEDSPVLSGGKMGPHMIQGIGAGFIPGNYHADVVDEIVTCSNDHAIETAKKLAHKEGLLCGISAGANVWAAHQVARRPENRDKVVVTIICDTGERYISTLLFYED